MAGYATPAWTNGAAPAIHAANLLALGQAVELGEHPYGVCSTAAATAAKAVTIDFSGTLSLFAGLTVRVKFSNSNSAANPTLNVNSTGAKSIMSYGTTKATTWIAGQTIEFVYDGTNWMMVGIDGYTKGQSLSSATASAINTLTGTTPTTPDSALSLLTQAIAGTVKVETGSYTGTGSYGQESPTSITFTNTPALVIVTTSVWGLLPSPSTWYTWYNGFIWTSGQTDTRNGGSLLTMSLSGKTLSWYTDSAVNQLNAAGTHYRYVAIGV